MLWLELLLALRHIAVRAVAAAVARARRRPALAWLSGCALPLAWGTDRYISHAGGAAAGRHACAR